MFEKATNNLLKRDLPLPLYLDNYIHHQICIQALHDNFISDWPITKKTEENFFTHLIKIGILKRKNDKPKNKN